ncbi:hypothetical protein [Nocardia phage NS-I]|nr:hypothetical protein [Nocardia phage NS-I]
MTAGHRDLDPTEAWVSRLPERCNDAEGLAELAETVAGEDGLAWLEGRITGETTVDLDPFDTEITGALDDLVDTAKSKVANLRHRWRRP